MTNLPASDSTSAAFTLLDSRIQQWIWEQKWEELRDFQEAAIRAILPDSGQDILLTAGTASGKTEAVFLPLLTRALARKQTGLQTLCVSPLRALINDQFARLDLLCERLDIPVYRWHGDVDAGARQKLLRHPAGILLITPESLEAFFINRGTTVARLFGTLDAVVVDELHAFIGSERGRQLQSLLHRLEAATGKRVRRIALSATLADLDMAADFLRPGEGATVARIAASSSGAGVLAQLKAVVEPTEYSASEEPGSADESESPAAFEAIAKDLYRALRGRHNLVFANDRRLVEMFADMLRARTEQNGVPEEFFAHHGSLSRDLREYVEARLKDRSRPVTATASAPSCTA